MDVGMIMRACVELLKDIALPSELHVLKGGKVLLENEQILNYESGAVELSLFDLDSEEEIVFVQWMDNETSGYVKDDFIKIRFIELDLMRRLFEEAEAECEAILAQDHDDPKTGKRIIMAHPAYDHCIKASHIFNLLDARGVISVTERQAYIGRVRALSKQCADAFVLTSAGGAAA